MNILAAPTKETMKKKSSTPNGKSAEEFRYQNIILEDMRSQIQTIAEGQQILNSKIDNVDQRLISEIKFTQQAIKTVHDSLKNDIQKVEIKLSGEIQRVETKLTDDIQKVEAKLSGEIQRVETKLSADIQRVERTLSEKIDRQGEKVERHDRDITTLKTAVAGR